MLNGAGILVSGAYTQGSLVTVGVTPKNCGANEFQGNPTNSAHGRGSAARPVPVKRIPWS